MEPKICPQWLLEGPGELKIALGGVPEGVREATGGQYQTRAAGIRFLEASWGGLEGLLGRSWGVLGSLEGRLGASWGCLGHLGGLWSLSWAPKSDLKSVPEAIILWILFLISF